MRNTSGSPQISVAHARRAAPDARGKYSEPRFRLIRHRRAGERHAAVVDGRLHERIRRDAPAHVRCGPRHRLRGRQSRRGGELCRLEACGEYARRPRELAPGREAAANQATEHRQSVEPLLEFHPRHVAGWVRIVGHELQALRLSRQEAICVGVRREKRAHGTGAIGGRRREKAAARRPAHDFWYAQLRVGHHIDCPDVGLQPRQTRGLCPGQIGNAPGRLKICEARHVCGGDRIPRRPHVKVRGRRPLVSTLRPKIEGDQGEGHQQRDKDEPAGDSTRSQVTSVSPHDSLYSSLRTINVKTYCSAGIRLLSLGVGASLTRRNRYFWNTPSASASDSVWRFTVPLAVSPTRSPSCITAVPAQTHVVFVGHRESSTTCSKVTVSGSSAMAAVSPMRTSNSCPRRADMGRPCPGPVGTRRRARMCAARLASSAPPHAWHAPSSGRSRGRAAQTRLAATVGSDQSARQRVSTCDCSGILVHTPAPTIIANRTEHHEAR